MDRPDNWLRVYRSCDWDEMDIAAYEYRHGRLTTNRRQQQIIANLQANDERFVLTWYPSWSKAGHFASWSVAQDQDDDYGNGCGPACSEMHTFGAGCRLT